MPDDTDDMPFSQMDNYNDIVAELSYRTGLATEIIERVLDAVDAMIVEDESL